MGAMIPSIVSCNIFSLTSPTQPDYVEKHVGAQYQPASNPPNKYKIFKPDPKSVS